MLLLGFVYTHQTVDDVYILFGCVRAIWKREREREEGYWYGDLIDIKIDRMAIQSY